jgi:hypothetical protein
MMQIHFSSLSSQAYSNRSIPNRHAAPAASHDTFIRFGKDEDKEPDKAAKEAAKAMQEQPGRSAQDYQDGGAGK